MEQVDVKIVTVDAVNNLADLKQAIKDAKDNLATMNLGSKEYQKQLKEVIEGQNLLRAAMNGTTATAEHLKDAIDKDGVSYNSLVNQMANLKRQFRATTDEVERANLGARIRDINTELKRLDAMKGDFQRNVGDYLAKDLKSVVQDLPSGLKAIRGPLDDVSKTMGLMSKQPILGILGLLAPLINEIVKGLKENDAALAGVKKGMDALKPVMDFFSTILDNIVNYLGDIISKAADFLSSSGIFNQVIKGVMGVGNAILQFVIAPFKAVGAAIKVFKEQGVKGIGDAARAMNDEFNKGIAFKTNFKTGQDFAVTLVSGAKSKKPGKQIADTIKKEMEEEFKAEDLQKIWEAAMAKWQKKQSEARAQRAEKDSIINEVTDMMDAELNAEIEQYLEAERIMYETSVKMAEEAAKKKIAVMNAYASGTSELLTSIADMMEAQGGEDEKAVKSAKNLRIAAATIDMIQGAVTAFSTAQSLGPIAGPIVGAVNAAAVVASGLANIAKIRATNVSKDSSPSSSSPESPSIQAPVLETAVPTTTVVNGASTEAALNRASQPQRVYILQSDIEAAGEASQVQVAESSF